MGTADKPTADTDSGRRQALLDSLDYLVGTTRLREIQYRIEMTESRAADLRAIDWPLRGCRHQGRTLYGDDISELERQIADLNAILDSAQARDEWDRYTHLAGCLLNQALDELTLAVQAGSLTPGSTRKRNLKHARRATDAPSVIHDQPASLADPPLSSACSEGYGMPGLNAAAGWAAIV